jgi:hypothetical protein
MTDEASERKIPRTVQNAIQAFDDAERAQHFADKKNHAHRNAVLRMALDKEAADWQDFYHTETGRIMREYEDRSARERDASQGT